MQPWVLLAGDFLGEQRGRNPWIVEQQWEEVRRGRQHSIGSYLEKLGCKEERW